MSRKNAARWICMFALAWSTFAVRATPVVVDFESFFDGDALTNQVFGLTFANATVISAGLSLNDAEFPPQSGANVAFDSGGEMVIDFASAVGAVGGYFTYATRLTFTAYDGSLTAVASDQSSFSANTALTGEAGSAPNEFIGVANAGGILRIVIAGDPSGGSFVLDDLTFETRGQVPEPGSLLLVTSAIAALGICRRRRV